MLAQTGMSAFNNQEGQQEQQHPALEDPTASQPLEQAQHQDTEAAAASAAGGEPPYRYARHLVDDCNRVVQRMTKDGSLDSSRRKERGWQFWGNANVQARRWKQTLAARRPCAACVHGRPPLCYPPC